MFYKEDEILAFIYSEKRYKTANTIEHLTKWKNRLSHEQSR